ncbi:MogA/MoaB family molybdenum cofactor biosynthesis protein [Bacillus niameyensis]|uniref:MogA/MoaB family molybdenum cofactor biosynthesis protein n=1 Tax=Bacillus niameyensis TaxID=1522308 RepID=UPI0007822B09|nr:molybdenum cofactor biosynthesis protein B [Bacillus niameyensis]
MSVIDHKRQSPDAVSCAVLTVSDTRTAETDKSGKLVMELLEEKGHRTTFYKIVHDDTNQIQAAVEEACGKSDTDVILITGGTGIAKRDITIETVSPLFEKEIIGFGEIFRMVSYLEDIGSAAILSRATAGIYQNKAIFVMPGSSGAVRLAMNKLILNELSHIVRELNK